MFMFRSKRAVLTRRLLKAKVRGEHETECETQEDTFTRINVPNCSYNGSTSGGGLTCGRSTQVTSAQEQRGSSARAQNRSATVANRANSVANRFHQGCCGGDYSHDEDDDEQRRQKNHHHNNQNHQQRNGQQNRLTRCKELLKSLKDNQLEMLLNVVENYGADFGGCVLVPRNKHNSSPPRRLSPVGKRNSPPESPIISGKQQRESMEQCNRHQRCGLASSLHENPARRISHRHLMRSRRNHGGSRCSRCVACHGDEQRGGSGSGVRDESSCSTDEDPTESRDNEINLRVVDGASNPSAVIASEDLRQEQPAWNGADSSKCRTVGVGLLTGESAGASRPERDRCRRGCEKFCRMMMTGTTMPTTMTATATATATSTGTRKRRESPTSGEPSGSDSGIDGPLDDPHLLSCQIWRWPDLANSSELKKLPVCHSAKDPVYTCCNPYHWSRLCKPESPPPPYCLIPDRLRPEDRAPSESSGDYRRCGTTTSPPPHSGSLTTNGEGGGEMGQKEWCTLAYWELGGRVGRLYPVEPSTVNVFDSLHDGDGLCLATLSENHTSSPAVQRTRSKIGLGLMLSQESDGVWAYNRSDSPIFVNSPTLDDPESRTLLVYRVPPGFCLNIFDRAKTIQLPRSLSQNSPTSASFNSGPVDVNSVRISFAKGWGPKYSRQEVTSCPCWLEVLLAPCR